MGLNKSNIEKCVFDETNGIIKNINLCAITHHQLVLILLFQNGSGYSLSINFGKKENFLKLNPLGQNIVCFDILTPPSRDDSIGASNISVADHETKYIYSLSRRRRKGGTNNHQAGYVVSVFKYPASNQDQTTIRPNNNNYNIFDYEFERIAQHNIDNKIFFVQKPPTTSEKLTDNQININHDHSMVDLTGMAVHYNQRQIYLWSESGDLFEFEIEHSRGNAINGGGAFYYFDQNRFLYLLVLHSSGLIGTNDDDKNQTLSAYNLQIFDLLYDNRKVSQIKLKFEKIHQILKVSAFYDSKCNNYIVAFLSRTNKDDESESKYMVHLYRVIDDATTDDIMPVEYTSANSDNILHFVMNNYYVALHDNRHRLLLFKIIAKMDGKEQNNGEYITIQGNNSNVQIVEDFLFFTNIQNQLIFIDLSYQYNAIGDTDGDVTSDEDMISAISCPLLQHQLIITELWIHPTLPTLLVFQDETSAVFFYDLESDYLSPVQLLDDNNNNYQHSTTRTWTLTWQSYDDYSNVIYPNPVFVVSKLGASIPPSPTTTTTLTSNELFVFTFIRNHVKGPQLVLIDRVSINNFIQFNDHVFSHVSPTIITLKMESLHFFSLDKEVGESNDASSHRVTKDSTILSSNSIPTPLNLKATFCLEKLNFKGVLVVGLGKTSQANFNTGNYDEEFQKLCVITFGNALEIASLDVAWHILINQLLLKTNTRSSPDELPVETSIINNRHHHNDFIIRALDLFRIDHALNACKRFGELQTYDCLKELAHCENISVITEAIDKLKLKKSSPNDHVLDIDHSTSVQEDLRIAIMALQKHHQQKCGSGKGTLSGITENIIKGCRDQSRSVNQKIKSLTTLSNIIGLNVAGNIGPKNEMPERGTAAIQNGDLGQNTADQVGLGNYNRGQMKKEINDLIRYDYTKKIFNLIDEAEIDISTLMEDLDLNIDHLPQLYLKMAQYFESKDSKVLAGENYLKAGLHLQSFQNMMAYLESDCSGEIKDYKLYGRALKGAATAVSELIKKENTLESGDKGLLESKKIEHYMHRIVTFLLRSSNTSQDLESLLDLYINCEKYVEANKIALTICTSKRNAGLFEEAHKLLYETFYKLEERTSALVKDEKIVTEELRLQLLLSHSYKLAKILIKDKLDENSALLLVRLIEEFPFQFFNLPLLSSTDKGQEQLIDARNLEEDEDKDDNNNDKRLKQQYLSILTTTVLQCNKAGLNDIAYRLAIKVFEEIKTYQTPNEHVEKDKIHHYKFDITQHHKIKLQNIIRKRRSNTTEDSVTHKFKYNLLNSWVPCEKCDREFEIYKIKCPHCERNNFNRYCILTGLRLPPELLDKNSETRLISRCLGCRFEFYDEFVTEFNKTGFVKCPMCETKALPTS